MNDFKNFRISFHPHQWTFLFKSQDFLFTTIFNFFQTSSWVSCWLKTSSRNASETVYLVFMMLPFHSRFRSQTMENFFFDRSAKKSPRKKSKEVRSKGKNMNHAPAPFLSAAKRKRLKIFAFLLRPFLQRFSVKVIATWRTVQSFFIAFRRFHFTTKSKM